jgi:hypothetical protein
MSPNAGGGGSYGVSANEYSYAPGAQINFGDLTPFLTYEGSNQSRSMCSVRGRNVGGVLEWRLAGGGHARGQNMQALAISVMALAVWWPAKSGSDEAPCLAYTWKVDEV